MKNEKVRKVVSVCAVMVMVLGLSIAFAYFSDVVEFGGDVSVTPGNWDVAITGGTPSSGQAYTTGNASIEGTKVTIPELNFTSPGQSVRYDFQVTNEGDVRAYLKNITFGDITCTAEEGTDPTMVNAACANMSVSISTWGLVNGETDPDCFFAEINKASGYSFKEGCKLEPGEYTKFALVIKYGGSAVADGPFAVTIGETKILYASNKGY